MGIRPDWRERLAALVPVGQRKRVSLAAGLNETFLRDTLAPGGSEPREKSVDALSKVLGVPATNWFREPEPAEPVNVRPANGLPVPTFDALQRNIPVLGSAKCGEDGAFEYHTGEVVDYALRPQKLSNVNNLYCVYAIGESMDPWRRSGALVMVHPGRPPQIGDHVVIQLKPEKPGDAPPAYIKKLEKLDDRRVVVSQYNPAKTLSWPRSQVLSIHRVLEWEEIWG